MESEDTHKRWCEDLEARLGHTFEKDELLRTALTHSSYVNENADQGDRNSERLEFLGDAVLDLAVGHMLMERYPKADEGLLTQARSAVVSEQTLAEAARELDLGGWLRLGRGEEQTGGRNKNSLLADAYEAVVAAVYLDGGFDRAVEVVENLLGGRLAHAMREVQNRDPKSRVQEHIQARHRMLPEYVLVAESGPEHAKQFDVALLLWGRELSRGVGYSKKEAEQDAARRLLEQVDRDPTVLDP